MLRFKRDDGTGYPEWEEKALSDMVEHFGGTALEKYITNDGICKFISIGNYSPDGRYIDNGNRINPEGKAKDKRLNKNDLVMVLNDKTAAGTIIGSTILIDDDNYIYNQRSERLVCKKIVLPQFMWCYLNSFVVKNKILKMKQGATQIYVNFNTVYSMDLKCPCLEEQQKIVDFLLEVDNIIAESEREIESLESQKKGAMQKIFSQEVRFKADDGSEYPAWGEKQISQLFSISAGGDIDKEKCTPEMTDNNIYPVYANATAKNGLYGYTDTFRIEGETITVTGRGDVGIAKARKEKYYPIVRLLVLKPKENLDILFFEAVINRAKFYEEYTGVPQLTAPQVGKIKVKFPCLEEQQKIADFLSELDNAIEYAKEELEVWKNIKKGLLQQMFE